MSKRINNLSVLKVLRIDSFSVYFFMFLTIPWCIYVVLEILYKIFGRFYMGKGFYVDERGIAIFFYIALTATVSCLLGISIRYAQFKFLLKNYIVVKGQFRGYDLLEKGYSSITYYFEYSGKKYYDNRYIPKRNFVFPKMRKFKDGDELHFILNPKNPKRNLILELYDINIDV